MKPTGAAGCLPEEWWVGTHPTARYTAGTTPEIDQAIALWPALDRFVGTSAEGESDLESFARLGDILGSGATGPEPAGGLEVRGEEVGAAAGSEAAGLKQGQGGRAGGRRREPAP